MTSRSARNRLPGQRNQKSKGTIIPLHVWWQNGVKGQIPPFNFLGSTALIHLPWNFKMKKEPSNAFFPSLSVSISFWQMVDVLTDIDANCKFFWQWQDLLLLIYLISFFFFWQWQSILNFFSFFGQWQNSLQMPYLFFFLSFWQLMKGYNPEISFKHTKMMAQNIWTYTWSDIVTLNSSLIKVWSVPLNYNWNFESWMERVTHYFFTNLCIY